MSGLQRTPQWYADRLGHVGGSDVYDIVKKLKKGGYSAARDELKRRIATERLTGKPSPHYVSDAMRDGIIREDEARSLYALYEEVEVTEAGFIKHPRMLWTGCSPDGLVDKHPKYKGKGGVEIKCPQPEAHRDTFRAGKAPEIYIPQVFWNMAVTGRQWWNFVSWNPDFLDEDHRYFIQHFKRNEAYISELTREVGRFLDEVAMEVDADRGGDLARSTLMEQLKASAHNVVDLTEKRE